MPSNDTGNPTVGTATEDLDYSRVTVGKPTQGGACFTAFTPVTLPTDAATALGDGFESLGELSENGLTLSSGLSSTEHKGWHGDPVLVTVDEAKNQFKVEFLEVTRPAVAKIRYGAGNVKVDSTTGEVTSISVKAPDNSPRPLVFDELMSNGKLRRIVVPKASINSIDDESHKQGSLLVYGMTFTAIPTNGVAYHVYYAEPAEGEGTEMTDQQ